MAFITFDESLKTHITKIDSDHIKLVDLINQLFEAMKKGEANEILGKLLLDLTQYTVFHFGMEEAFMDSYDYPDFKFHKVEHEKLIAEVKELNENMKNGSAVLSIKTLNFLKSWLADHIINSDKKLGDFLKNRGIE